MKLSHCFLVLGVAAGVAVASDAGAFQFYAPWTSMGDADGWYAMGPDPTPSPKIGASFFYGVATTRSRMGASGRERFVTVESRNTTDEGLRGCSRAPGWADLGMPRVSAANPGLAPGQPFWVSTPALAQNWVFVTVLDAPMPINTPDFQFHGHVYAKHRDASGADLCTGWAADWVDLGHGVVFAGSAPSALTIPAGRPGAGNTYMCTDSMHLFDSPGSITCRHTSDNVHWSAWQQISSDNSLTYVVGRPMMAYDPCKGRVVVGQAAKDRSVMFFLQFGVDPATGDLAGIGNTRAGQDPTVNWGRVEVPGESWQVAGTPSLGFVGCTLHAVVRVARTVDVSGSTVPATGTLGNPVVYMTGHHDGSQLMTGGWTWGPRLDTTPATVGIAQMLPAPVKGSSLTMIIDRNDFGRHYWQFTLGAAGFGNRTLYNLDDPGSVTPVARPGIAAPTAPIRR